MRIAVRILASAISVAGVLLLARVLYMAADGSLVEKVAPQWAGLSMANVYALGLALPVPFHVISIGLILQHRWLPRRTARVAWWAIVISGCWLGVALAVKSL